MLAIDDLKVIDIQDFRYPKNTKFYRCYSFFFVQELALSVRIHQAQTACLQGLIPHIRHL